jgi:hypothetical protein
MDDVAAAFVPPSEIFAAIIACAILPVLLLVLGREIFRRMSLGRRFVVAVFGAIVVWVVLILILPVWGVGDAEVRLVNLIAGALVMVTGVLVAFSLWSLLAYGFTISMLLSLAQSGTPLALDEWRQTYGGVGLEQFGQDRIGVLLGFRLVRQKAERLEIVSGRGQLFAGLVHIADVLFSIDRESEG